MLLNFYPNGFLSFLPQAKQHCMSFTPLETNKDQSSREVAAWRRTPGVNNEYLKLSPYRIRLDLECAAEPGEP